VVSTWIIGTPEAEARDYTIGAGFDLKSHPGRLLLSNVPAAFAEWLKTCAAELGIEVSEVDDLSNPPVELVDDIVVLGADPDVVETVSPRPGNFGILAVMASKPMSRKVNLDIGRVHYNRWVYVGSTGADVARAYSDVPVRSTLKPGGKAWFVGAGGPMGRMHVQRAVQVANGPSVILNSDVSDARLDDLCSSFGSEAHEKGIEWICLNPMNREELPGWPGSVQGGWV
jgi:L-sorbose 1-phosphate reductase